MNDYSLITFKSTHHAIRFEKVIKENNFNAEIIPVPRQIHDSCGLAVKVKNQFLNDIIIIAKSKNIEMLKIYNINVQNSIKTYNEII